MPGEVSHYGLPGIGFIAWPDMVAFVQRLRGAFPRHDLLVDIDDGYVDTEVSALGGATAVSAMAPRPARTSSYATSALADGARGLLLASRGQVAPRTRCRALDAVRAGGARGRPTAHGRGHGGRGGAPERHSYLYETLHGVRSALEEAEILERIGA